MNHLKIVSLILLATTAHASDDLSLAAPKLPQGKISCMSPELYAKDLGTHYNVRMTENVFDAAIANGLDDNITGVQLQLTFKNNLGSVLVRHQLEVDVNVTAQTHEVIEWKPDIFSVSDGSKLIKLVALAKTHAKNIDCKVTKYVLDTGKVINQK